ncbi:ChbG/HpnK family deacetylase [Pseudactinotalea suaedae]|uniref:ChbG/HpnK family deacetylase n=1 Tax=Pseudactinotalea suaedae TaxID=1524924 RepID=UPI0012E297A8|nr:ChbG/HpnK family deacetylase [Pseudactinotalea suaedae]
MTERRLVVTADDLGRDPRTDATVLDLLREGHVTATTLLAVAPGAADAAAGAVALGSTPRLHATITSERGLAPWPPRSPGSAVMADGGALPLDTGLALARASVDDVVAEVAAQLAWMRAQGMAPAGLDSHAGTLYGLDGGPWLHPVLRWCASEGLAFRLPRDLRPYLGRPEPEVAALHARAVALADDLGVALPAAMITNRSSAAALGRYETLRQQLVVALDSLPAGTSELFLHPADGLPGPVGQVRAWEARLLRDPVWHDAVASAAVELVGDWWSNP